MSEIIVLSKDELEQLIKTTVQETVSNLPVKRFPDPLTKKQLAEYVDKPVSTINRWMREGLPHRKEGKDYPEFYKPQVDEWLERRFNNFHIQEISREADHAKGQELGARNVVYLEKKSGQDNSQGHTRSKDKRASGNSRA